MADYSTSEDVKTQVDVELPQYLADKFKGVETGEEIMPTNKGLKLKVILKDRRARLFYGSPGWGN